MDYETEANTLFGNVLFYPSEKLEVFANTYWNTGTAAITGATLDPSGLVKQPSGLNYPMLAENIGSLSSIDIERFSQVLGFNFQVSDGLIWHAVAEYDDFGDNDPYLYSTDGSYFLFTSGVMITF